MLFFLEKIELDLYVFAVEVSTVFFYFCACMFHSVRITRLLFSVLQVGFFLLSLLYLDLGRG